MKYYIGIDSGGTKTDSVLLDGIGRVLYRQSDNGCNPNDIGIDAAKEKILGIIQNLTQKSPEHVSAVFAGIAGIVGFGNGFTDYLREKTGIEALRAETDAIPLLTSVLYRSDGCCVISGTGSACFIRSKGELSRVGGWGFMLDNGGSGYDLGRDAIAAVLHEYDGQGGETALTGLLTSRMGAHPKDTIPEIYKGGRSYIASFANVIFEGCRMGDSVSLDIMNRNAEYIAGMIKIAARKINGIFTVALGGGIFKNYPEFIAALRELVPGRIRLTLNDMPSVYGSAVEAVYTAGNEISYGFKDNFTETYNNSLN